MASERGENFRIRLKTGRSIALRSPTQGTDLLATLTQVSDNSITARLTSAVGQSLRAGDKILVEYPDAEALYFFFVKAIEISESDVVLSPPTTGIEFQRRKSARVGASVPFHGLVASASQDDLIGEILQGLKTEDIGPQGLKFRTDLPIEIGDTLLLWLYLSKKHSVKVHAWVVWTEPGQRDSKTFNSVGASFLQLGPEEQMQLMQFLGRHQTSDRREFARWETSIPCKIGCGDDQIEGEIANLSVDGALVTSVRSLPPERGTVVLTIPVEDIQVVLASKITTQVVHTAWKMTGEHEEESGIFGVEFIESGEELRHKLTPVLRELFSKRKCSISGSAV